MTSKLKRSLNPNFNWTRWLNRAGKKILTLEEALGEAARKKATSVSMQNLLDTGRGDMLPKGYANSNDKERGAVVKKQIATFLYREMPVICASCRELARLPHGLGQQPSIVRSKMVQTVVCRPCTTATAKNG